MDVDERMHDPIFVLGKKKMPSWSSHSMNQRNTEQAVLHQLLNTQGLSSQIHAEGFFGWILDDMAIFASIEIE